MRHICLLVLPVVSLLACTDTHSPASPSDEVVPPVGKTPAAQPFFRPDPADFETQDGWPEHVRRRVLDAGYETEVERIVADPTHDRVWTVVRTRAQESDSQFVYALHGHDGRGELVVDSRDVPALARHLGVEGAAIGDLARHPDGSLSILVLTPKPGELPSPAELSTSHMHLMRLAPDGRVLREAPFAPEHPPEDWVVCQYLDGDISCLPTDDVNPSETIRRLPYGGLANRLVADGDALLFLRAAGPNFLYRLDAQYGVERSTRLYPFSNENWGYVPALAHDDAGRVTVALWADATMFELLAAAGGPQLAMPEGVAGDRDAVLLWSFDARTLETKANRVLATPDGGLFSAALVPDGQETIVVMNGMLTRSTTENDTKQRDIVVARVDPETTHSELQLVDVARDDFAAAAALGPDGSLWIGGQTNFVQVDTNSVVEDPEGLLVQLSRDGRVLRSERLRGPRAVTVASIAPLPGQLLLGGTLDGPITHTCDGDASFAACGNRGYFGVMDLP